MNTNHRPIHLRPFDAPVSPGEMNRLPGREVREKRTRSGKIYDLGRGLHQAVLFADPVHYRDKSGQWQEIDNTLVSEADERGFPYLTNRANDDLRVEFHSTIAPAAVLLANADGQTLAWQLEGAEAVQPRKEEKARGRLAADDRRRGVMPRTEAEVLYEGIFHGADLRCRVQGVSFKDEVIFHTAESLRPVTFLLAMPGLIPEKRPGGDVQLIAPDGEAAFTLPAPFMTDSVESSCGHVDVSLVPTSESGVWRMTYTPDAAWAAHAVLPVTLDPAVVTKHESTAIEDNFVSSSHPVDHYVYNKSRLIVSRSEGKGCTAYIRFLDSELPEIDSSYYVTKAFFSIATRETVSSAATVLLKEVNGAWDSKTITYNNAPKPENLALDYAYMDKANTWFTYDISNLVRKWYTGQNHGFALEAADDTYLELYSSDHLDNKPFVTINYISLAGLEDYLAYEEQPVGRAGTGYVSLYNGNLIFTRQDTTCSRNRMPISVSHIYNSCYHNVTDFGAGRGWRMNLQQCLHKETLTDTSGSSTYYVYTDGDGTRHHFKSISGEWKDQSGLGMTLTISGSTVTLRDKGDNTLVFDLPTAEFNNNYANVKMLKSMADACGNKATINTNGRFLVNAFDAANWETNFASIDNRVCQIYAPGYYESSYCGFEYDAGGNLTKVWELDGKPGTVEMTYTYDSRGLLTSATNCDGVKVSYEYYTAREPYRVKKVTVTGGGLTGMSRQYEYRDCLTVVTDLVTGKKLYYHFNDCGNVVSVNDELGYACFAKYSDSLPINHPEAISKMQKVVCNLFKNHGFAKSAEWSISSNGGTGTTAYDSQRYMGVRSMKMNKTNSTGNLYFHQSVTVAKGKPYTVSAYIKGDTAMGMQFSLALHDSAGATIWNGSPTYAVTGSWQRVSYTFTVPTTASDGVVRFCMCGVNGPGALWFDGMQLEEGPVANSYNMLLNGDFSYNSGAHPADWLKNSSNDANDIVRTTYDGVKPAGLSANTMRLYGTGRTKYAGIYQDLAVSGKQGDVFVAGGWALTHSKPRRGEEFRFDIRVAFLKSGTSSTRENAPSIEWSEEWTGWQFAAGPVVAPCDFTAIRFNVDYERNINYTDFDGFFLYKEEFGQTYQYDAKGNVLATKDAAKIKDGATYDAFNNILTYFQPGRSTAKTTMEWGTTDAERKKHLLRKSTSPLGTVSEYTYDSYGNPLTAKTTGGTAFMQTKTVYDKEGNHAIEEYDARGMCVKRAVDPNRDTLTSVTDPRGQTVNYTYDNNRRVTRTSATANGKTYTNNYAYDKDKLVQVKHNTSADAADDVTYGFAYDALGRPTTVKVGTQTLSTTAYNANGTVGSVTYGNGTQIFNTYDDFKRLTAVGFAADAPRFTYEYGANGQVARATDHALCVTSTSEYDTANRPMRLTRLRTGTNEHIYTGEVAYDQYNNPAAFRERVGANRDAYATAFAYDAENRPTALDYGSGRSASYAYDQLGRLKTRTVNGYKTTYSYLAGGHGAGSTTPLIERMTQYSEDFAYQYDAAGNIVAAERNGKRTTYEYDMLGQLVRVNDPDDGTWVYEYDLGGNVLNQKKYLYTDGALGEVLHTDTFAYDDANWKDKLTSFNGQEITYDAIGNPLNDGAWTYEWERGRILKRMKKGEAGEPGYEELIYTYNMDGLRLCKERLYYNEENKQMAHESTEYVLHGKNIVHMQHGADSLHFYYDAQNRPAVVEWNGASYAYVYNLQGDVVALVDSNGTKVVKYTYDAWGKPLGRTGALARTLGILNPFRYRGYVFDEETGLYYLRSRYYNPSQKRFVNADSVLTISKVSLNCNGFAYCANQPISRLDSTGLSADSITVPSGNKLFACLHGVVGSGGGGIVATVGAVSLSRRISDYYTNLSALIAGLFASDPAEVSLSEHINWGNGSNPHVLHGSRNHGGHDWSPFGIEPNDPKGWDKLLPLLKVVADQGQKWTNPNETKPIPNVEYFIYYFEQYSHSIVIKLFNSGDQTSLSNAYPFP